MVRMTDKRARSTGTSPAADGETRVATPYVAPGHEPAAPPSVEDFFPVQRAFAWITESSWPSFAVVSAALVLARSGWQQHKSIDDLLAYARSFPTPTPSYKSSAVIGPAIAHALGISDAPGWWSLHAVLTVLVLGVAAGLTIRRASDRASARLALVWLCLAPGATCLLQLIGHYDVFVLLGATLLGFARGSGMALAAGVLVGATNPSQACIILPAYACVALGLGRHRVSTTLGFAAGAIASAGLVAYGHASLGVATTSRTSLVFVNALRGLRGLLIDGTMATYSWYAVAWALVLAVLHAHRAERRAFVLLSAGLVGLPALACAFTLDGTRVFVCCAWAGFCLLLWDLGARRATWERRLPLRALTSLAAIGSLLAPAYITWVNGHLAEPWWQQWMPPQ